MTWNLITKPALFAALAACLCVPAAAQDDFLPLTEPVDLDPANPQAEEFGELIYRGGVAIEPGEYEIGGISGIEWHEDRLYAVIDDGRWLAIMPDEIGGKLVDIFSVSGGDLDDLRGRRLRGKEEGDAEAIARDADGAWLIAFEREHRIWRYENFESEPTAYTGIAIADFVSPERSNNGVEALARTGDITLLCGEFSGLTQPNCRRVDGGSTLDIEIAATMDGAQLVPTDASCASDGTCYVLLRSYTPGLGNHIAIVALAQDGTLATMAEFAPTLTLDNFEGLAVREAGGKTFLYLASDNNFSDDQRNLLMKFEIKSEEAPSVEDFADAPEPEVTYESVDVVLETTLGEITIALAVEQAPITAANFLRYVDEDRFDGTVFYRAMQVAWGEGPNGLIQGGPRNDPDKILDPIEHEPTTLTGLSHTRGAVSMAMGEPGTANGDFTIMLGDMSGLDARPDSDQPVLRHGFPVFGFVIDGMDVVQAIHAAQIDDTLGHGVMVGQMLADPVVILDARRVEASAD